MLAADDIKLYRKNSASVPVIRGNLHITDVNFGNCIEIHFTENPRKSPEILILKPACRAVTVNLDRKPVFLFLEIRCDFKFRGGKAVLGITNKFTVQPHKKRCFNSLKTDVGFLPEKRSVNIEKLDVAPDRIAFLRYLRRNKLFLSLPRILRVDILRLAVTLKLNVSRNFYIIEARYIKIIPVKIGRTFRLFFGVSEFPDTVQTLTKISLICGITMVGMCRLTADSENRRVRKPV